MFCLIYRSVATLSFGRQEIRQMLDKARDKNKKLGITGCLLFYEGEFIQYLEGNQIKVLELFDEIKKDNRHNNIELISYAQREGREFENWEMAYEDFFGDNDQITYLKLLIGSYFEDTDDSSSPHPASMPFWRTVHKLLNTKSKPNV
ncbi:MAG: BLUF domain-containing protein [Flavobacteriaceae bacterium]